MGSVADELAPHAPQRVGRYELLLPIGTGGMATVFLARTHVVGDLYREVAVKLMHPQLRAEDDEWSEQLMDEAKLAAAIRHPNVVSVMEVGEDVHGVHLVMEYVEGDTLAAMLRAAQKAGGHIPLPIAGRILLHALAGLHAAHELHDSDGRPSHLIHRDFSPQNILVGSDGMTRLTDFGVAKSTNRVGVTKAGIVKGKVAYMAPEQALNKEIDRRVDVWAAGVVTWELLAGRRLYEDADQVATLLAIATKEPRDLRSVRPDLPERLAAVVMRALTIDTSRRWKTAAEFGKALAAAWREMGEIAEVSEVASYVKRVVGPKLAARKKRVNSVLELREKLNTVSQTAMDVAETSSPSHPPVGVLDAATIARASEPTLHASVVEHQELLQRRRRRRMLPVALAAVVGVIGLAGALVLLISQEAPAPMAVAGAPVSSRLHAVSIQSPPPAAPAVRDNAAVISANASMVSLQIGKRLISLPAATREVEVELKEKEQGQELEVRARAKDGRRTSGRLTAGSNQLKLEFEEPRAGAAAPARSAKPTTPLGLIPTPYSPK